MVKSEIVFLASQGKKAKVNFASSALLLSSLNSTPFLYCSNLSIHGVKFLPGMPNLKSLVLDNCDGDFRNFVQNKFSNLEMLGVSNCSYLSKLPAMPKLRFIYIKDCKNLLRPCPPPLENFGFFSNEEIFAIFSLKDMEITSMSGETGEIFTFPISKSEPILLLKKTIYRLEVVTILSNYQIEEYQGKIDRMIASKITSEFAPAQIEKFALQFAMDVWKGAKYG